MIIIRVGKILFLHHSVRC